MLLKFCSEHLAYLGSFTNAVLGGCRLQDGNIGEIIDWRANLANIFFEKINFPPIRELKFLTGHMAYIWLILKSYKRQQPCLVTFLLKFMLCMELVYLQCVIITLGLRNIIIFIQDQIFCIHLLCSNTLAVTLYWLPLQSIEQATFKSRRRRGKS